MASNMDQLSEKVFCLLAMQIKKVVDISRSIQDTMKMSMRIIDSNPNI